MASMAHQVPSGEGQSRAIGEILTDLRSMYNSPQFSDVTFVCKDGGRVPACRLFLSARSSMLRGMLTNGMSESSQVEIALAEVSAPVMRSVVEYLYTGAIKCLTWNLALGVVVAARFFLLESLEENVWDSITGGPLASREITVTEAALRLTEALKFPDLWESSRKGILQAVVRVLDSGCLQDYSHLRGLSEQAFGYYLEHTQGDYENAPACSVATYLRFRQISLWCAGQLVPRQDNVVSKLLPTAESLSAVVEAPDRDEGGETMKLDIEIRQALAASIEPWLTRVNLRLLHPALLMKVVKPSKILPRRLKKQLMRFHVLERARELHGEEWECGLDHNSHGSSMMLCNKVESTIELYSTVRVCRDSDLQSQIGTDIHFDLVDFSKVRRFCINKQTPFSQFKELLARQSGIPPNCQRFLVWARRQNKTYRPSGVLKHEEESKTVHEIYWTHCDRIGVLKHLRTSSTLNLFLDVETSNGVPIPLSPIGVYNILLFLKFYCPETEELRYVGRTYVSARNKPIDLREKLLDLAGLSTDDSIILYEEVRFDESQVMCERLQQEFTFSHNQIEMGDIICYQKALGAAEHERLRFPDVPSFYNHIRAQLV